MKEITRLAKMWYNEGYISEHKYKEIKERNKNVPPINSKEYSHKGRLAKV